MSDADNAHDRETDEWIVPASLRAKGPASTEGGPVQQHERRGSSMSEQNVHAPTLTRDGFTEALRALGRDGGEPDRCGRGSCCLMDGHEGRCER